MRKFSPTDSWKKHVLCRRDLQSARCPAVRPVFLSFDKIFFSARQRYKNRRHFDEVVEPSSAGFGIFFRFCTVRFVSSQWSKRMGPIEVMTHYFIVTSSASEMAKKKVPSQLNVPYGCNGRQKLDIFGTETLPSDAPIFVYLHGGYWMMGCREDSSWMVEPLYNSGIATIVIGYDLAPKVTIDEIVEEISEALSFIVNYAERRNSKGVYICGHSAGGHLAAMALSSKLLHSKCNSKDFIKGLITISGVFDLAPLLHTNVSKDVNLTKEVCDRNSPVRLVKEFAHHFEDQKPFAFVVVGEEESPEYYRQSKEYHEALVNEGFESEYLTVSEVDHFSVVENLRDASFSLVKDIVTRIKA